MKLHDCIVTIPDALDSNMCDLIVNEYKNSDEWVLSKMAEGAYAEIRNSSVITISSGATIEKNREIRKRIDSALFNAFSNSLRQYADRFPRIHIQNDVGYDLLKYEEGQFLKSHVDTNKSNAFTLSCSIQLSDEFEGGEWGFFDGSHVVRQKKGEAIVFPSNFLFPHEVKPVISGTRYSVVTWFQ